MTPRLSEKFLKKIVNFFKTLPLLPGESLYIFGSRVKPEARGGDIDLLLECNDAERFKVFQKEKTKLKNKLIKLLDDQKVDLKVSMDKDQDPFVRSIRESAVLLCKGS